MNADQAGGRVAQPADEELKKHGDQLEKQVRDAAGERPRGPDAGKPPPAATGGQTRDGADGADGADSAASGPP